MSGTTYFIAHEPKKEVVRKARRPKRVSNTYKRVYALSQQMSRAVAVNFIHGIKTFKKKVDPNALYEAWKTGSYGDILRVIPFDTLHDDLKGMQKPLKTTIDRTGGFVIDALPPPIKKEFRYDTKNPNIRDYLDKRTGDLIVNISMDTQHLVQQAVQRSFDEALHPNTVAQMIKGSIGLYPRLEQAVDNYRRGLGKQGMDPDRVASLVDKYQDRLLEYRAMMIARTETRMATNQGQLDIWQQGAKQGLIDLNTSKKVWIVDGNPCEICDPMDGIGVGLYDMWTLNDGRVVNIPTESHPHCMCGMEIKYGESEQKIEENQVQDENYTEE